MKNPALKLKELRQHFGLSTQQVTRKAVPIFLWVILAPLLLIPLIYLTITSNPLHTRVVFICIAVTLLALLTLSSNVLSFLICIAIYRAKGESTPKAIHSAFDTFRHR
jgi:hypothetical protein